MDDFDRSAADPRDAYFLDAKSQLGRAAHLDDVIDIVRRKGREVCASDGICLVLRDGELCHYVAENAISPLWKGQRFPMSACISGWSMLNGQTAAIEDVFADPRIPHDVYRPTFVKSLIMTPVGIPLPGPVAALGAYWSVRRSFAPAEIMMVKNLALAVGVAMAGVEV